MSGAPPPTPPRSGSNVDSAPISKVGFLWKRGGSKMSFMSKESWKWRYFELIGGQLKYYTDKNSRYVKGIVRLDRDATCRPRDDVKVDGGVCFELVVNERAKPILLKAKTDAEMNEWIAAISSNVGKTA